VETFVAYQEKNEAYTGTMRTFLWFSTGNARAAPANPLIWEEESLLQTSQLHYASYPILESA
jgi:hypothetical protein